MRKIVLALLLLFVAHEGLAACSGSSPNWTAADCSNVEVAACITAASSGDTIHVPAGTCTWNARVTIPANKTVHLKGSGRTTTIINRAGQAILSSSPNTTISGFRFNLISGDLPLVEMQNVGWRVHNNYFDNQTEVSKEGVRLSGTNMDMLPEGLVDSNIFNECRILALGMGTFAKKNAAWLKDSVIGKRNTVFIENNTITRTSGNAMDANYGASYVFRFNNVTVEVMAHSLQEAQGRGTKSWEVYNNAFTHNNYAMAFMRGGTGMLFNNTIKGNYGGAYIIALDNVRSHTTFGSNPSSGRCDGSSLWDGNVLGNGWPCRDQIGRGPDTALFNPPTYSASTSEPAFFWNNQRDNGQNVAVNIVNGCSAWIVEGRDYYSATTYEGLAVKPTHYTPYTCPHPLADPNGEYHCDFEIAGTAGYGMAGAPDPDPDPPDPEPTGLILPWVITGG